VKDIIVAIAMLCAQAPGPELCQKWYVECAECGNKVGDCIKLRAEPTPCEHYAPLSADPYEDAHRSRCDRQFNNSGCKRFNKTFKYDEGAK